MLEMNLKNSWIAEQKNGKLMKRFLVIAMLALASCARVESEIETISSVVKAYDSFVISVENPDDTKVHLEGVGAVKWDVGDRIGVYSDLQGPVEFRRGEDGVFYGQTPVTGTRFYAFYPYDCFGYDGNNPEVLRTDNKNSCSKTNPLGLLMVAKSSDNNLYFTQTCGLLHFSFRCERSATLQAVFRGNDDEPVFGWGRVDLTEEKPRFVLDNDMTSCTLDSEQVTMAQGGVCDFYFQVPPMVFKNGINLTVKETDTETGGEKTYFKHTSKEVTVSRGLMKSFAVFGGNEGEESWQQEREALIAFYYAMGGPNWKDNTNWCSDKDVSEWVGVNTAGSYDGRHVSSIWLGDNNLIGKYENQLQQLRQLQLIDLSRNNISEVSFDGMQSLETIYIQDSPVTKVVVRDTPKLITFSSNRSSLLSELELPDNVQEILISQASVTNFDLSKFPQLTWFDGSGLDMPIINTNNNPELQSFVCESANIQSVDFSGSPKLFQINLSGNSYITSIDLSKQTELENLFMGFCNKLSYVNVSHSSKLKQLILGKMPCSFDSVLQLEKTDFPDLFNLDLTGNNLPSVDVSGYPKIKQLVVGANALKTLDVSQNPVLETLGISDNPGMREIDLSNNPLLEQFDCACSGGAEQGLLALDFTKNPKLKYLTFSNTAITDIDLSKNLSLVEVHIEKNSLLDYVTVSTSQSFTCHKDEHTKFKFVESGEFLYSSSDYSLDGTVELLQAATEGAGINVVLMGDAFSDRQHADGTYRGTMEKAMGALFSFEPLKSYRDCFNVYMVNVVSPNEVVSSFTSTALRFTFDDRGYPSGDSRACINYAFKALQKDDMDNSIILAFVNKENPQGRTQMFFPEDLTQPYSSGLGIVYMGTQSDDVLFRKVLTHEVGHAFAKLGDEYFYNDQYLGLVDVAVTETDIATLDTYASIGWYKNIDYVKDKAKCKWASYIGHPSYPEVDYYEGAARHPDLYRPTFNSLMRDHAYGEGFNVPSREAIYYRIHRLAYGPEWVFSRDAFINFDQSVKVNHAPAQFRVSAYGKKSITQSSPPIIVRKSWQEFMKLGNGTVD